MSDFIPQDLFLLILKPLPVKTLLQFRSVCKSWKELIDSKSFILSHLSLRSPRLIVQNQEFKYVVFDPQTLPLFDEISGPYEIQPEDPDSHNTEIDSEIEDLYDVVVVSTIHGVICLYDHPNLLLLWNPSIRRYWKLPFPQFSPSIPDLFVDPWPDDFKCCGFWMDPCDCYFKAVVFFLVKGVIALFSSKNKVWIQVPFESERLLYNSWSWTKDPMILIDGVGHWMLFDHCFNEHGLIVSFDFGLDKFGGTIEFPQLEESEDLNYAVCMLKWRNCVAIVHWGLLSPCACQFWALQNGSWSKMFSVNVVVDIRRVFYVSEDYNRVLVLPRNGPLVLYDRENRSSIPVESEDCTRHLCAYDFVESLVFPIQKCIAYSSDSL